MKVFSVMSLVLSVALLAGIAFLVLEMSDLSGRIDELEANRAKDTRQLSNDISTAFTRIGELDTEIRGLSKRTDAVATRGLDASVENIIETKLAERETRRREGWTQRGRDWQARREELQLNELVEALQLDEETKEKMKGILVQSRKDMQKFFGKLREDGNWDREKIRAGLQNINNQMDEAAKKIVSEEQFKKYMEIQTEARQWWENMAQRWGNRGGGGQPPH